MQKSRIISAVHTPMPLRDESSRIASSSLFCQIPSKSNAPVWTFSAKSVMYSAFLNVMPSDWSLETPAARTGLGVDLAECRQHPLPDRLLCLGRDLLADDVVHNGGKEVSIHFSLDMADAVDDLGHALILLFKIVGLLFPVGKIH